VIFFKKNLTIYGEVNNEILQQQKRTKPRFADMPVSNFSPHRTCKCGEACILIPKYTLFTIDERATYTPWHISPRRGLRICWNV
jgi:hypothetical protein